MARTPLHIIESYIAIYEASQKLPTVIRDSQKMKELEAKIHILKTVKLEIELEQEIEAYEQRFQGGKED